MKKTYIRPTIRVRKVEVEQQILAASTGFGEVTDKTMDISSESADPSWGADAKPRTFINWDDGE